MTAKNICLLWVVFYLGVPLGFAQSRLDYLKDQPYLKDKSQVNCNEPFTTLDLRICANLRAQASDSLMQLTYREVWDALAQRSSESVQVKLKKAQELWLEMRDQECGIYWDLYAGGSFQPIIFMHCLADITDDRTKALKRLAAEINGN